jgi:hypothetical protein
MATLRSTSLYRVQVVRGAVLMFMGEKVIKKQRRSKETGILMVNSDVARSGVSNPVMAAKHFGA